MSNLNINLTHSNITKVNPSVNPKLKLEGKFNYPVIGLGSNNFDGAVYSIDGGRHWLDVDTLGNNTEYTLITGSGLGSYMNISPNLQDVCIWSWSQGGAVGSCFQHLSHDLGRTWTVTEFTNSKHEYSTYIKDDPKIMYVGGWQGNGLYSEDAGDTFSNITLQNSRVPVVFDASDNGHYVYAGTSALKEIQYSHDSGNTWTSVSVSSAGTNNARVVKCSSSGQYVFAYYGIYGIEVDFSDDYGQTFTNLANSANGRPEMRRDGSAVFYTSPSTSRIYYSTNQGSSWSFFASPFGTDTTQSFRQDYINNIIYMNSRNTNIIYKINSNNDGLDIVKTLENNTWLFETSKYGRGYIYVVNNNGNEGDVYFSRNTQTWERIWENDNTNIGRYPVIL